MLSDLYYCYKSIETTVCRRATGTWSGATVRDLAAQPPDPTETQTPLAPWTQDERHR